MLTISGCESGWKQFNEDGTVLRGIVNPLDVGIFQINEYYHLNSAEALGIDIYTTEGNIQFARLLYNGLSTTPWNWSKYCWGK